MEPWKNQPQMGGMGGMGQMPYQTQSGAMGNLAGLLKLLPGMGGQQPQQGQGFGPAVNNFAPRAFKKGGRVKTTDDLTAGAGSGDGRLEKIELQQSMKGKRP